MIDKTEGRTQNRESNLRGDQSASIKHMEDEGAPKHNAPMTGDTMQGREKRKNMDQGKPK